MELNLSKIYIYRKIRSCRNFLSLQSLITESKDIFESAGDWPSRCKWTHRPNVWLFLLPSTWYKWTLYPIPENIFLDTNLRILWKLFITWVSKSLWDGDLQHDRMTYYTRANNLFRVVPSILSLWVVSIL